MRKIYFLLLALCTLLVSCHSEMEELVENVQTEASGYTMDQVISRANLFHSFIKDGTRGGSSKVKDVMALPSRLTRGEAEDYNPSQVYYLINYENDEGFVIVGGNEHSDAVVAIADEGNLTLAALTNDNGLRSFYDHLFLPKDSSIFTIRPTDPIGPISPVAGPDVNVSPMIHKNVRKWGQGDPFNSFIPLENGQRPMIGSEAVAAAIMMSHIEWPDTLIFRFDWQAIKGNECHDDLKRLMGYVKPLAVNYGYEMKEDKLWKTYPSLQTLCVVLDLQYNSLAYFDISSKEKIKAQLPAMMVHLEESTDVYTAWVLDGFKCVPKELFDVGDPARRDYFFFHCIWGNYGVGNGYFEFNRMNKIGGTRHSKDGNDDIFPGHTDSSVVPVYSKEEMITYTIRKHWDPYLIFPEN